MFYYLLFPKKKKKKKRKTSAISKTLTSSVSAYCQTYIFTVHVFKVELTSSCYKVHCRKLAYSF